jgi:hypothetical protein
VGLIGQVMSATTPVRIYCRDRVQYASRTCDSSLSIRNKGRSLPREVDIRFPILGGMTGSEFGT